MDGETWTGVVCGKAAVCSKGERAARAQPQAVFDSLIKRSNLCQNQISWSECGSGQDAVGVCCCAERCARIQWLV